MPVNLQGLHVMEMQRRERSGYDRSALHMKITKERRARQAVPLHRYGGGDLHGKRCTTKEHLELNAFNSRCSYF